MEKSTRQNGSSMQQPKNHREFTGAINEPVLLTLIASRSIADVISQTGISSRHLVKLRDRFEI